LPDGADEAEWIVEAPEGNVPSLELFSPAVQWTNAATLGQPNPNETTLVTLEQGSDYWTSASPLTDGAFSLTYDEQPVSSVTQTPAPDPGGTSTGVTTTPPPSATTKPPRTTGTATPKPVTVKVTGLCQLIGRHEACHSLTGHTLKVHQGVTAITVRFKLSRALRRHLTAVRLSGPANTLPSILGSTGARTDKSGQASMKIEIRHTRELQITVSGDLFLLNLKLVREQ
jgi:hypothetical protein